jgi:hypothetical protein
MARGRRVELGPKFAIEDMQPGDYLRPKPVVDPNNVESWWIARTPTGQSARLCPAWFKVIEWRNGSITVNPSIHVEGEDCDWLLTRGIWSAHRRRPPSRPPGANGAHR